MQVFKLHLWKLLNYLDLLKMIEKRKSRQVLLNVRGQKRKKVRKTNSFIFATLEATARGWCIKNATGLIILLKMVIYLIFLTSLIKNDIFWDLTTSKDSEINFDLTDECVLLTFQTNQWLCLDWFLFASTWFASKNFFCVLICNFWLKQDTEMCCTLK